MLCILGTIYNQTKRNSTIAYKGYRQTKRKAADIFFYGYHEISF